MRNYVWLILINSYWGFTTILMKHALFFMNSITYVSLRLLLGALSCLVIYHKNMISLNKDIMIKSSILGILLAVNLELTVWGLAYTSATNCVFILQLSLIVIPVIESILNKNKITMRLLFVIIGIIIGTLIMIGSIDMSINIGDILIFVSMLANSLFLILASKYAKYYDVKVLSVIQLFIAATITLIISLLLDFNIRINPQSILILILTGVVGSGIAYTFQMFAQKEVSATVVSLISVLQPVFGALGVSLLPDMYGYREKITINQYIGGIMILVVLLIYTIPQYYNSKKSRANNS